MGDIRKGVCSSKSCQRLKVKIISLPKQVSLKSVDQRETRAPVKMDDEQDIGNALKRALELINDAKHDFSESSDSDSDNSDW